MAYFRLKKGKPWHIAKPGTRKSLCNVDAKPTTIYTRELYQRETLCTNCAMLHAGMFTGKDSNAPNVFVIQHREAKAAEARGDYAHLPHTEDIIAHIAANRPISELAAWCETGNKIK